MMIFTLTTPCKIFRRIKGIILNIFFIIRLTVVSLCYNDFLDKYYVLDTCMEPLFWFVDHFTKVMGPVFVAMVQILTYSIVVIAYVFGLPYWIHHSLVITIIGVTVGHWLLININFHYYMAYTTAPGKPPELIPEAVSICKKCIAPKPPRTHHCSICNVCILKMDHHCPWLDNCIGHFNHRYFFMYCVYMWLGVVFIMVFGFHIFSEHFFADNPTNDSSNYITSSSNSSGLSIPKYHVPYYTIVDPNSNFYHTCLVYATFICIGVCIVLGALITWHAQLISSGETSIEAHINKKERERLKKQGKKYQNPYDFGPRANWKLFLGITDGCNFTSLLFPSKHKPSGDGLRWFTSERDHIMLYTEKNEGIT